jgi:hypothetical protein
LGFTGLWVMDGPQVQVTSIAVCSAAMSRWPRVARRALGFLRTRLGLPSMGRASQDPGMGPAAYLVSLTLEGSPVSVRGPQEPPYLSMDSLSLP